MIQTSHSPLLKIAPDLRNEDIHEIVEVAVSSGISGIIALTQRLLVPKTFWMLSKTNQVLSGAPLFELSTQKLAQTFLAAKRRIPVIGVGGVDKAETAYTKVKAGACLSSFIPR